MKKISKAIISIMIVFVLAHLSKKATEEQRERMLEKMFWFLLIFLLTGLTFFGGFSGFCAGLLFIFFFVYKKEKKSRY